MKTPKDLSREELEEIVSFVQGRLYLDLSGDAPDTLSDSEVEAGIQPNSDYWNPTKEWDVDFLDHIANELDKHGLVPSKPEACAEEQTD